MSTPTYLITLATGQQGRATIAALLQTGRAKIHAVVRDPSKPAARALASQGVTLFEGSNDDAPAFRAAARGCTALFLNVLSWPANPDPARQARGILQACGEAGVSHVVASTSGWAGSEDRWGVAALRGTWLAEYNRREAAVEEVVRGAGFASFTILRPVWFFANYLPPVSERYYPGLFRVNTSIKGDGNGGEEGKGEGEGATEARMGAEFVHSFKPGRAFPHVDVPDVGRFAAMALQDPATFDRQEIELAAQNLTVDEVVDAIRKVTGRDVGLRTRTPEETERDTGIVEWQVWGNEADLTVDTEALEREYGFKFTTFEEFLRREKDQLLG